MFWWRCRESNSVLIVASDMPYTNTHPHYLIIIRCQCFGGDSRTRTDHLLLAKQMLSQMSYAPKSFSISGPYWTITVGNITSNINAVVITNAANPFRELQYFLIFIPLFGTEGETRTLTLFRVLDPKSSVTTNSTTPALLYQFNINIIQN